MSLRCGCSDQGDEVVFGQCRKCFPNPEEPQADQVDIVGALFGAMLRAHQLRQADFTLSPQEPRDRPYEITLDEAERHD